MIGFRPFVNSDPPAVAELWRCQTSRGYAQPISTALLDQLVFGKPYFDREGLILALDDGRPVGFVHAGFGADETESALSTELGVTAMLVVHPAEDQPAIAAQLLAHSEAYLRQRGAKILYGGGIHPVAPFYLGLYGGSELPGVLESDTAMHGYFAQAGYKPIDRVLVLHRELAGFRPIVDRQQMQIRRRVQIGITNDPPPTTWWNACSFGPFERAQMQLTDSAGQVLASVCFWNMDTFSHAWGAFAVGLVELWVDADHRRQGLSTYLLGEAFRHLHSLGVAVVEAQVMQHNTAARGLFEKLGFRQVDAGTVWRK